MPLASLHGLTLTSCAEVGMGHGTGIPGFRGWAPTVGAVKGGGAAAAAGVVGSGAEVCVG